MSGVSQIGGKAKYRLTECCRKGNTYNLLLSPGHIYCILSEFQNGTSVPQKVQSSQKSKCSVCIFHYKGIKFAYLIVPLIGDVPLVYSLVNLAICHDELLGRV